MVRAGGRAGTRVGDRRDDGGAGVVRRALAAHGHSAGTVRRLGAGLDHAAYEVDGRLVVRLATGPGGGDEVVREARLLDAVADAVPLPVPRPVLVDARRGLLAYPLLPGRPALDLDNALHHAEELGSQLGPFLAALHALPADGLPLEPDDTPAAEWLTDAARLYDDVRPHIPPVHRSAVERFLAADPPPADGTRVPAHNDLGIEHVLVDRGTWVVTGVIDWSDAALTDPARDLGLVLRDLGPGGLRAVLAAYLPGPHRRLTERAWFYARCAALEDLSYGVETGAGGYAAKTLDALPWLFP